MQHIGPLLKRIRLDKGLTLKNVSEGIISIAFLSKFENEKNDISASNLLALLQRMQVSPDEFYRLTSNYNSTPIHEFITDLVPAFVNDDVLLLNQKLEELDENKDQIEPFFYTHYKILIKHFINYVSKLPVDPSDTNKIITYLMANDSWGTYEVYLYTNFIKFIPLEMNKQLLKKAKQSAAHYVNKDSYKHAVVVIQINFINKLINERKTLLARDLINELLEDLVNSKYFYEINKLHYLKGKAMISDGKISQGKKYAQQAIETMYQLQNDSLGRTHQKSLDNLINTVEFELKENL